MTLPHLHLVLTHLPVVGMILSFVLIVYALWRKNQGATDIALAGIFLSGVSALPVFWSGEAAEDAVEGLPGILESAVEAHENAALTAAILAVAAAAVALATLLVRKRRPQWAGWSQTATLAAALVAIVAISWTANLGGRIRHPEIAPGAALSLPAAGGEGSEAGLLLQGGERDEDDDDDDDRRNGHDDDD